VALEFGPVPGDGETTFGKRVVARALQAYGSGFLRVLIMDAAYLDCEWLRELKDEHDIDWVIKSKERMVVVEEMRRVARELGERCPVPPPKLDLPQKQLTNRHLGHNPKLYGFVTYGRPVNGCAVRDRYPLTPKHSEGLETKEFLLTNRGDGKAGAINGARRRCWDVESTLVS
jgi:hypothetical protein